MVSKGKKVFIALSGGVDSAVSASLLIKAGYDCAAVHMITSDEGQAHCADAEKIAEDLNMPIHILDLRREFRIVLDYFCDEYKKARTPNPCVFCNRVIKFGKVLDYAFANGADYIATGHYARVIDGQIYTASDLKKDQSYVLSMIDRAKIPHILLPLGNFNKTQTRRLAGRLGLHIESKPDSQEICFIPNDDYAADLEKLCPELIKDGKVVDSNGKVLGSHQGIYKYTIGQRRGLKIAMGQPYYVTKLDSDSNTVVLGPREELFHKTLIASGVNWLIDMPKEPFAAKVKIRYNHRGSNGVVYPEADKVKVIFDEPISAITPGQAAVFYIEAPHGFHLAGGAWIDEVKD